MMLTGVLSVHDIWFLILSHIIAEFQSIAS